MGAEGFAGENDPYNAYAFGGPRCKPPYRVLAQVELPHAWGHQWLGREFEMGIRAARVVCARFPEAMGWTESATHMAYIERKRTQREWASDELLEQLAENE